MEYAIRRARTSDVRAIGGLVDDNVDSGPLLAKATVTLYEDVQEFWIAERAGDGEVIGAGLFTSCGRTWPRSGPSRFAPIARKGASATGWWRRCWAARANWACGGCSC